MSLVTCWPERPAWLTQTHTSWLLFQARQQVHYVFVCLNGMVSFVVCELNGCAENQPEWAVHFHCWCQADFMTGTLYITCAHKSPVLSKLHYFLNLYASGAFKHSVFVSSPWGRELCETFFNPHWVLAIFNQAKENLTHFIIVLSKEPWYFLLLYKFVLLENITL